MNTSASEKIPDLRWVLRYSAIAFLLVTLWQSVSVIVAVPKFQPMFAGFGANLPPVTNFTMNYYWLGSAVVTVVSLVSVGYLLVRPCAPAARLKAAYIVSLSALVGAFLWTGFVLNAMYAPIFLLGQPI